MIEVQVRDHNTNPDLKVLRISREYVTRAEAYKKAEAYKNKSNVETSTPTELANLHIENYNIGAGITAKPTVIWGSVYAIWPVPAAAAKSLAKAISTVINDTWFVYGSAVVDKAGLEELKAKKPQIFAPSSPPYDDCGVCEEDCDCINNDDDDEDEDEDENQEYWNDLKAKFKEKGLRTITIDVETQIVNYRGPEGYSIVMNPDLAESIEAHLLELVGVL